jgi:hypothetical protein
MDNTLVRFETAMFLRDHRAGYLERRTYFDAAGAGVATRFYICGTRVSKEQFRAVAQQFGITSFTRSLEQPYTYLPEEPVEVWVESEWLNSHLVPAYIDDD